MNNIICPQCSSKNVSETISFVDLDTNTSGSIDTFHCDDCDYWWEKDEIEREMIRKILDGNNALDKENFILIPLFLIQRLIGWVLGMYFLIALALYFYYYATEFKVFRYYGPISETGISFMDEHQMNLIIKALKWPLILF